MQPPQANRIYEFGDFELDARRRVLVSRNDGRPVDITGRVVEALVYLVERPGQLVAKKELIDALWPHVVVEDGNLTQTIHTLRKVLGEKAGEHRYIATAPGRGYRFVAEVRIRAEDEASVEAGPARDVTPASEPAGGPRPAWVVAGLAVSVILLIVVAALAWRGRDLPVTKPAVPARPSIAVLAFVDMSPEQDQVYFAEGLSEEILNLLARADALRVIARTSSFSFKDQSADIRTIAKRLAVSHVLEGSVRKSGERVRITAQLIDAATSAHVWSDTYDRDVQDVFGVQREIAAAVADALHVTLRSAGPTRSETRSPEAYQHYLQGRHLFQRRSGDDLLQAKAHFEKAVQIDPTYGRAWSALAGVYLVARYEHGELPNAMQNWGEAAKRGVELAPDLAEAHYRAAQYYWHAGDSRAGYAHLNRALALDPQDPLVIGMTVSEAINEGRLEEAITLQRRLVAVDPLSATSRGNLGALLMLAGLLPDAQAELERALELSPASVNSTFAIADVLILQGRADEAFKVISRMPDNYRRDERVALAHFARGDVDEGNAMLERLLARAERPEPDATSAVSLSVVIAEVYATRKDPDRAFEWLDKAHQLMQARPEGLKPWVMRENLQMTPHLKSLHADPRWKALLLSIKK
jgi:TolB-like protein/DNA-binding winged helix-turn-helix (wHTH) protein/tetratricopeptide (TPR) repeat protein